MKRLLFAMIATLVSASICRADAWTEDYTRLLSKYATPQGAKYAAWHDNAADRAALAKVVAAIAHEKPEGSRDEKLAFYLNAYNANILEGVLERYPIKSVRETSLHSLASSRKTTSPRRAKR